MSTNVERDTAEGWIENPDPVNKETAMRWLSQHEVAGAELRGFFEDLGDRDMYGSDEVFAWLGY